MCIRRPDPNILRPSTPFEPAESPTRSRPPVDPRDQEDELQDMIHGTSEPARAADVDPWVDSTFAL